MPTLAHGQGRMTVVLHITENLGLLSPIPAMLVSAWALFCTLPSCGKAGCGRPQINHPKKKRISLPRSFYRPLEGCLHARPVSGHLCSQGVRSVLRKKDGRERTYQETKD